MKTGTSKLMDSHLVDFTNPNANSIKSGSTTSSQTEISDEEIFYQKQVMNPYPSTKHFYTAWEKGFMDCAKWYREQLKK